MAVGPILCLTLLALSATNAGSHSKRNFITDSFGSASTALGIDNLVYGGTKALGTVENLISPSATRAFCESNGYTVWVGRGPPPQAENAVGSAWSAWGSLTGAAVGAWAPAVAIQAKCDAAGWAKPGTTTATQPGGQVTYVTGPPTTTGGSPPGTTVQYVTIPGYPGTYQYTSSPGTPGTYTKVTTSGTPGTYQVSTTPGTPGSYQVNSTPGAPGSYQVNTTPGTPGSYQVNTTPGTPGSYQVNTTPGTPGSYQVNTTPGTLPPGNPPVNSSPGSPGSYVSSYTPGTPGTSTTTYFPGTTGSAQTSPPMCSCPCQG